MFIQTASQLPSVQNDVLTGQYAGLYNCVEYNIYLYTSVFTWTFFASHFLSFYTFLFKYNIFAKKKQQLYVIFGKNFLFTIVFVYIFEVCVCL